LCVIKKVVNSSERQRAVPDVRAHELFGAQVRARGEHPAVSHGARTVSYAELDAQANAIARLLVREGVGPETIVGVCVERSIEMVAAVLGVLKAGGAYLPLDPAYPPDRLAFMLEDSATEVVVTQQRLADQAAAFGRKLLVLDGDAPLGDQEATAPPRRTHELNLAYVIYTSGSTGRPKGVALHHRGLTNHVLTSNEVFRIGPSRRVLQFASLSFDAAVQEIFGTLAAGGELVLMRDGEWLEAASFSAFLRDRRVNVVTLPPSLLAEERPDGLLELETLVSAGEACNEEIVAAWGPGRRLLNGYGPTECTVGIAYSPPLEPGAPITVGTTMPNFRAHILDHELRPAPIGAPGELYIGGEGVGRGYLGRPGLTAERFVPDPFAADPGERLYRTGDLASRDADGRIALLGRVDSQIKIRGYRIELGEIESVLARHPAVRGAAAVAGRTPAGDACIVAFVTGSGGDSLVPALQEHCGSQLPRYMIPSRIVPLAALPTLPNGKVDRQALGRAAAPGGG
jgi:amino acid adenylation domain-containing protein